MAQIIIIFFFCVEKLAQWKPIKTITTLKPSLLKFNMVGLFWTKGDALFPNWRLQQILKLRY